MANTFTPPIAPTYSGTTRDRDYRLITATFGDGYRLDMADGLNASQGSFVFAWDLITLDQLTQIEAFLEANIGQTFLWSIPQITPVTKFKATKGLQVTVRGFNAYQASMTLIQSFEIV